MEDVDISGRTEYSRQRCAHACVCDLCVCVRVYVSSPFVCPPSLALAQRCLRVWGFCKCDSLLYCFVFLLSRSSRRASSTPFVKSRDSGLDMVTLRKYQGPPGSSLKAQPFTVDVAASALILADIHAHLSMDGERLQLCDVA